MLVEPDEACPVGRRRIVAPAIPGLVWAFRLHSDGSAEPLPIDTPIEFGHDGRLWLHFNLTDARVRDHGSRQATFRYCARDLLLSKDNYPAAPHHRIIVFTAYFPIWSATSTPRPRKPDFFASP